MSKPPRFFILSEQISGTQIFIAGEDVHHITTVLRMVPGRLLILCDGKGMEYTVRIAKVGRTEVITEIESETKRGPFYPRIVLGQALPKAEKMDFIVQKATELGVESIVPLVTERTIIKIKDGQKRVTRWQKICREAAMQSNRIDIPNVTSITPFRNFIMTLEPEPFTLNLLPWEEESRRIKGVLQNHQGINKVNVLIGPEGGFSIAEVKIAMAREFNLVSLGPNILRTETAAVSVLSIIGYEYHRDVGR